MKRLFGTDGIRAVAGSPPLDRATVRRFGAALARVLRADGRPAPRIVLGRDTRESGVWLRDCLTSGLVAGGARPVDAGVITTPGLARALERGELVAGVMISASHNPFRDNGLKVFGPGGVKLSDEAERRIERLILDEGIEDPGDRPGPVEHDPGLAAGYVAFLEQVIDRPQRFRGLRLVLDCANGAASAIAPAVFRHYGAETTVIGAEPNGRNINLGCGSMHLERLASTVRDGGHDAGIAFDGDADRALAVDRRGGLVDGDLILYLAARHLLRRGRLRGGAVVATILTNLWLEQRLGEEGVAVRRSAVGDKYVLQRMLEDDLALGGEQSGHVIFRDHATTGDGILTGLLLLDAVLDESQPLEAIVEGIRPCPQVQLNVPVRDKPDLRSHPSIGPATAEVERALAGHGRVILRYSGTEPVARVMVEGSDAEAVRRHAERLAETIRSALGA